MTDQELVEAEASEQSVMIAILTREDYKRLIYSGRKGVIGELLMIAERGNAALDLWLIRFGLMISSAGF